MKIYIFLMAIMNGDKSEKFKFQDANGSARTSGASKLDMVDELPTLNDGEKEIPRRAQSKHLSDGDEGYDEQLLMNLDSFESMNINNGNTLKLQRKTSPIDPFANFFERVGNIPDIDDISVVASGDEDGKDEREKERKSSEKPDKDIGSFVHPLTGEEPEELVELEEEIEEVHIAEVEDEEEEESEESDFEAYDLLLMADQDEDVGVTQKSVAEEQDVEELFVAKKTVRTSMTVDDEELARAIEHGEVRKDIENFVGSLLDHVVSYCEYVNPDVVLRESLDAKKVVESLTSALTELAAEKKVLEFLHRKTIEYFRRKKQFRCLKPAHRASVQDTKRLMDAIQALEKVMCEKRESENKINEKLEVLKQESVELEEKLNNENKIFEDLVRRTLLRDGIGLDRLKQFIEYNFGKMRRLRDDISKERSSFIQKQHSLATLIQKTEEIERLGDDLSLRKYENIQAENVALREKIEERESDLDRLRRICHESLHTMSHLREMEVMSETTLNVEQQHLNQLNEDSQHNRKYLHTLKLRRNRIKRNLEELRIEGGLLYSKQLLYDYDDTKEQLNELRTKIEDKKYQLKDSQQQLRDLEIFYNEII